MGEDRGWDGLESRGTKTPKKLRCLTFNFPCKKQVDFAKWCTWVAQSATHLPSAQVTMSGSGARGPH